MRTIGYVLKWELADLIKKVDSILNLSVQDPMNVMHNVIFSSNHHFSAISWNIFIQFEVIVYETLFLLLVF